MHVSKLFFESFLFFFTNGNVGIGTTAPETVFHVKGDTGLTSVGASWVTILRGLTEGMWFRVTGLYANTASRVGYFEVVGIFAGTPVILHSTNVLGSLGSTPTFQMSDGDLQVKDALDSGSKRWTTLSIQQSKSNMLGW